MCLALLAFGTIAAAAECVTFEETLVADVGDVATAMAFAPDGRLFILEKDGHVRIVKDGVLLDAPFLRLDVEDRSERGLLGIALDPAFEDNGYVYLYYIRPGLTRAYAWARVSRFTARGDVAEHGSERVLVEIPRPGVTHIGGALHFGPDGKLYVALGERVSILPGAASKELVERQGRILRLNADGSIPEDNPFFEETEGLYRATWVYGLRNPFTFAFDIDGRAYVNDVGERRFEEINELARGANYGWPRCEGECAVEGVANPIYQYAHDEGRAITGGVFYRGGHLPQSLVGSYFFGDYTAGWIRRLDPVSGEVDMFWPAADSPVDLDVGPDGALYYLSLGGQVFRISARAVE